MDTDPLEPFLPLIAGLATLIGQACIELALEDMPADKDRAHWTDEEKEALISFLVEQKISGKMGDGSFKTAIWNAAATHLSERFPNQKGPMKTAEMCKGKVTSLKTVLRDINLWRARSGKHWDNSSGANIATEDEEKDFQDWMGSRPGNSMRLFKNSGWSLLEGMEVLFPNDQARGMRVYHPTTAKNTPGPSLSTNPSSTTSSDPVVTPPPSTPLPFTATWPDASPGVNTGDSIDGTPIEKEITPMQPPLFSHQIYPSHLAVPAPSSTTAFLTPQVPPSTTSSISSSRKRAYPADNTGIQTGVPQFPSAEAALQSFSLREDTERSSKRSKKNKEQSTPAVLVGVQGSLNYLGSVIDSSSPATAQRRRAEHMRTALQVLEEQDSDLPVVAQAALMEAFRMDVGTIDLYLMAKNRCLRRNWIQTCLRNLKLVPDDFVL